MYHEKSKVYNNNVCGILDEFLFRERILVFEVRFDLAHFAEVRVEVDRQISYYRDVR